MSRLSGDEFHDAVITATRQGADMRNVPDEVLRSLPGMISRLLRSTGFSEHLEYTMSGLPSFLSWLLDPIQTAEMITKVGVSGLKQLVTDLTDTGDITLPQESAALDIIDMIAPEARELANLSETSEYGFWPFGGGNTSSQTSSASIIASLKGTPITGIVGALELLLADGTINSTQYRNLVAMAPRISSGETGVWLDLKAVVPGILVTLLPLLVKAVQEFMSNRQSNHSEPIAV